MPRFDWLDWLIVYYYNRRERHADSGSSSGQDVDWLFIKLIYVLLRIMNMNVNMIVKNNTKMSYRTDFYTFFKHFYAIVWSS